MCNTISGDLMNLEMKFTDDQVVKSVHNTLQL